MGRATGLSNVPARHLGVRGARARRLPGKPPLQDLVLDFGRDRVVSPAGLRTVGERCVASRGTGSRGGEIPAGEDAVPAPRDERPPGVRAQAGQRAVVGVELDQLARLSGCEPHPRAVHVPADRTFVPPAAGNAGARERDHLREETTRLEVDGEPTVDGAARDTMVVDQGRGLAEGRDRPVEGDEEVPGDDRGVEAAVGDRPPELARMDVDGRDVVRGGDVKPAALGRRCRFAGPGVGAASGVTPRQRGQFPPAPRVNSLRAPRSHLRGQDGHPPADLRAHFPADLRGPLHPLSLASMASPISPTCPEGSISRELRRSRLGVTGPCQGPHADVGAAGRAAACSPRRRPSPPRARRRRRRCAACVVLRRDGSRARRSAA